MALNGSVRLDVTSLRPPDLPFTTTFSASWSSTYTAPGSTQIRSGLPGLARLRQNW